MLLQKLLDTFGNEWDGKRPLEIMELNLPRREFGAFQQHLMKDGTICSRGGMRLVCTERWHGFERYVAHAVSTEDDGFKWAFQMDYNPSKFMRCSIFKILLEGRQPGEAAAEGSSTVSCHSCRRTLVLSPPSPGSGSPSS